MQKYDLVKEEYKALISDWRLYLSRLKQVLDNEELKNTYRNESDKELFLKSIEDRLLKVLHGYIHQMNRMVESLSKQESTIYKKYYRENLNPLLRSSPLISSIIDKDLGYAGDFETIKLFFQNPYSGDTLFGKFVNKYLCSLDAVTAHVDRIRYISDQLCFAYKNSANDFSFLALGAGPAEEVLRFVENNSFEKPVFATLIDMDAYALADFSDRMQYLPKKNFTVDLQNLNVINLIRNEPSIEDRKYDLSYCAGMFDYFSDTFCKRLIKYLIKCTKPDGVAMFTNVSKDSMARYVMDYCGGWEIIHRNNAEIVALIPQEYHYELSHDEKKANIYAKIIVPKRNG